MMDILPSDLEIALGEFGLVGLGRLVSGVSPPAGLEARKEPFTLLLVGNAGPDMWRVFSAAPEYGSSPDRPDPLDRWSRRVLTELAGRFGAEILFPFDGPPYWPFQRWALAAGGVSTSPMGVLAHRIYGPWFAFRGALILPGDAAGAEAAVSKGPCHDCTTRPCLTACPVGAIVADGPDGGAYDVTLCRTHVASSPTVACATGGCLARHACPVGQAFAYPPAQARHHMRAFIN